MECMAPAATCYHKCHEPALPRCLPQVPLLLQIQPDLMLGTLLRWCTQ